MIAEIVCFCHPPISVTWLLRGPPQRAAAMKWVTLICVLLCTIATESRHLEKRDAEHHSRRIGDIFVEIGRTNFRHIVLVMSSQNFQKCPLAEHMKGVDELTAFAERCVENEDIEDCKKPMNTIFYDTACKDPQLGEVYPWGPECCAKTEPEREKCFHDHEDKNVEPFKRPDADAACKLQKDDPHEAYHYYAHTVARRHPTLLPPAVLELAEQYSMIMNECCAAEEREKCFDGKFVEVQKTTLYLEYQQKQTCHILKAFPDRVAHAKKLAKIAQKFPSIPLDVAHKLTVEWVHVAKDCCKDDVVECMVEKLEYVQHVCDNQEKISPNLKTCCEKPKLKRTPCIWALPKDDIPADLPKEMKEFVEDEHVCEHFAAEKDVFLEKFLYEFSRRHQELPNSGLLRAGIGYEELLTECCAKENPVECHKAAPQIFEARIKENMALTKQNCEAYEKAKPHIYQTILLGRYVPKMPQVSDETLLKITGKMTKFAGKCCALPKGQIMACAEDKLDFLLGEMCERESHTFINDQVHHCCVDSFSRRRPCFTKLGVDPTYKAPEFDENLFKVNADVCEGTEEEQKNKRLPLLIHVLKLKPDMSPEKTKEIVGEFIKVREECCAAGDRQDCFDKKRTDFLIHLKNIFAH